ncbi:MAG: hypothetical protein LBP25_01310 [Tannerellaceae bacterium]|nr:hypothetical protein [Tannerellaceae bacterium]
MLQKTIYLLLAFALLLAGGCKDNNEEMLKYQQPFLGQWQEIARGNETFPELTPDGHVIEFLTDGTMPGGTYHSRFPSGNRTDNYRVDAGSLYLNSGKPRDGYTYRYSFAGPDTLRLDLIYGMRTLSTDTPIFNIYERLKTNEQ